MTKFVKPGSIENYDYPDMAKEAGEKALKDANVSYNQIQAAYAGYVYGDSTCGQRALYEIGMTGIPIVNVNNNCSTGSTALVLARNAIAGGQVDCVMAIGFEKMQRGSLTSQFNDRSNPMEKHVEVMSNLYDISAAPMTAQFFGNAGKDYLKKYNLPEDDDCFARIAWKNHKHSVNNPYSQFRDEYSLDDIKKSPIVHEPLTKLQCCPTSDGAACVILASEEFVKKHNLQAKAVEILALEMATDLQSTFNDNNCMKLVGFDMTALAAKRAFEKAGIKPTDVQVVELHDCFSANELITYEALGLCEPGKAVEMVKKGDNTYGGKYVINPSGGLISKGHPLGATGLAQCSELCWQLRGDADKRQVSNCKYALQHNVGLGGAVVVGIYKLGFPTSSSNSSSSSNTTHKSAKFFKDIEDRIKTEGKALVSKINAIIGFDVKTSNGQNYFYIVDLKNGSGAVLLNSNSLKPEVTISISDDDLLAIMNGKLNMMSAFSQKKLKINGNMSIAMKLNQLFSNVKSKL